MADQQMSANALARKSGANRQVIANVLNGAVWPDMLTVEDLEGAPGVMRWPDRLEWKTPVTGAVAAMGELVIAAAPSS
ncbi:hypothetical protein [Streptomyces sp. YU58]|uniref:hypothetical protein n=1 Tax=Streptomyces sp. SX92 TaxID=3158972 RepID=UPI0027B8BD95|nr:hypothetical protein [Streptomyces coralus]WLW51079.1 hypothetical protein QU709_06785 [Streptomyces coralus]